MTSLRVTLALVLLVAAVLLAAGCVSENSNVPLEITGSTTVVVANVTSASDLEMKGIQNSEISDLFHGINRFDVVSFNLRNIRTQIQSQQGLPVRIRGKDYRAELTRQTSINVGNGFESYSGALFGEQNSSVLITILPTSFITGSISMNNETFWIVPIDKEAWNENSPTLHIIYNFHDAINYQNPNLTDITPSGKFLHYFHQDEKTGISYLTKKSLIGIEYPAIDGDHVVWSWVYYGKRGLTLYTISTGNYTEIKGEPFGLSPPKISGNYIVWADTAECLSKNQTNSLVLYNIATGNKTCICKSPASPRFAAISDPYVVWQDDIYFNNKTSAPPPNHMFYDIYLYDIRTGTESIILPNLSTQEYPSISEDRIVWSDYRNYPDGGYHKDIFLYNISDETVTTINTIPLFHTASAPYIYRNFILWSDEGKGMSSKVHLYNITSGQEQILDDSSSGMIGGFLISGNYIVMTSSEFQGSDVPEGKILLFNLDNLRKETKVPACLNNSSLISISGNNILVAGSDGFGLCPVE
jgi:hypothetical protein